MVCGTTPITWKPNALAPTATPRAVFPMDGTTSCLVRPSRPNRSSRWIVPRILKLPESARCSHLAHTCRCGKRLLSRTKGVGMVVNMITPLRHESVRSWGRFATCLERRGRLQTCPTKRAASRHSERAFLPTQDNNRRMLLSRPDVSVTQRRKEWATDCVHGPGYPRQRVARIPTDQTGESGRKTGAGSPHSRLFPFLRSDPC